MGAAPFPGKGRQHGKSKREEKQEGGQEAEQREAVATDQRIGDNCEPTTRARGSHVGTAPIPGEGRQHRESARKEKQGKSEKQIGARGERRPKQDRTKQ